MVYCAGKPIESVVYCLYNHPRRGDYSGGTNFQNNRLAFCQCVRRGNQFNERKCHPEEYKTRHKVRNDILQRKNVKIVP